MEIIRKKTDYAFRLMLNLSTNYGKGAVSARVLSNEEKVSYQLACKLLQQLHDAGYVKSRMGPNGGYFLSKTPSKISLADIVNVIQSPIRLRDCLLGFNYCPKKNSCTIHNELNRLGNYIDDFLSNLTLNQLMKMRHIDSENGENFLVSNDIRKVKGKSEPSIKKVKKV